MVIDRHVAAKNFQHIRSIGTRKCVDLGAGESAIKDTEHFFAGPTCALIEHVVVDERLDTIAAAIETSIGFHVNNLLTLRCYMCYHSQRTRFELARALATP